MDILLTKAERGLRQFGIDPNDLLTGSLKGSYMDAPLSVIEFALHEAAHLITLGYTPDQFDALPGFFHLYSLWTLVSKLLSDIDHESANQLEITTSYITYQVGVDLGLWTDPEEIVHSTYLNLKVSDLLPDDILYIFEDRAAKGADRILINRLTSWINYELAEK